MVEKKIEKQPVKPVKQFDCNKCRHTMGMSRLRCGTDILDMIMQSGVSTVETVYYCENKECDRYAVLCIGGIVHKEEEATG